LPRPKNGNHDPALVYTPAAQADLDGIFDFIATDNPRRALSYVQEIQDACEALRHTPMMGVARPDLRPDLRLLPLWRRLLVAYEMFPDHVDVLRVLSGGQDDDAIMAR
jgi:toxin ParE1/3/4